MDSLRSIWNQMPVIRLLLPFVAGIGICIGFNNALLVFSLLLLLSILLIIYINLLKSTAAVYRRRYVSGVAVSVAMLSLGYVVTYFNTDRNDPHYMLVANATYKGVITDAVVVKEKVVNALVEVDLVNEGSSTSHVSGKVLVSLVKDDKSQALQYGDEIIFSGAVKEYEEPKNPDQFNYRQYQALHHIYLHTYLNPDEWKLTASGKGNTLLAKIYDVRAYFLSLIKQEVSGTNELAVATAIMLGYRDYVTDDVTQAYAGSGVLHVLSVSGLHVAVLYFVLNMLLGWMDKRRRLQIVKGVLVIVIMLFYAGLTGLSPPVLRSVWMFTLITIAKLLDRDVSMYNVLGVSCLLLLIWDPYYVADVGFQLSYVAVVGIVYLYPMIFGWVEDTDIIKLRIKGLSFAVNWLSRWTWGLISVSIAAQIATLPISLFYFHTFPNYFLLSNLLVIPLSNFVLIAGMGLFVAGWSETLLLWVGWVFDHLLLLLNKVVFGIDILPFALSKGVMVNAFEMMLLYMVIIALCWYFVDRRAKVLIGSLCLMLVLCAAFSLHNIERQSKREIAVYSVKGKKTISIIDRGTVYYDFDSALIHDEVLMRNNIRSHWYASGVKAELAMDSMKGVYALSFGKVYDVEGKRLVVINEYSPHPRALSQGEGRNSQQQSKLKADIVVISAGYDGDVKRIADEFTFSQLVFDSSDKPWRIKKWKAECDALGVKYWNCAERAFVMEW